MESQQDYGMVISFENGPIHSEDELNDPNPLHSLWLLPFICDESGIETLKIFLDNNTDYEALEKGFLYHLILDMAFVSGDGLEHAGFREATIAGLKEIMMVASYRYILDNSEYLQQRVSLDKKDKSYLENFKDWNNFEYVITHPSTGNY